MKKHILIAILATIGLGGGLAITATPSRAQSIPQCASNGDKDGDGVADAADSDERDSCTASSSGYEDCSTGAGDGIPDCE